jgi:beta-galactosidase
MLPMNRGWRFSPRVVEGDTRQEFDDTAFMRVVIPHTNKVLPWHSFDGQEYEFISTYRRHFKLPRVLQGQRVFVDFRSGHDGFDSLDQRTQARRVQGWLHAVLL